jgi:hypothetical protein
MYELISGEFKHLGGRVLGVNGLRVLIPDDGKIHLGVELRVCEQVVAPFVCVLKEAFGQRYGIMHLGTEELVTIVEKIKDGKTGATNFKFFTPFRRPKVTAN